jgi:hypothetical protein
MFTTKPNELEEMSDEEQGRKKMKLEPEKSVLMFISQFAKVYHVERRTTKNGCCIPMILN